MDLWCDTHLWDTEADGFACKWWQTDGYDELEEGERQQYAIDPKRVRLNKISFGVKIIILPLIQKQSLFWILVIKLLRYSKILILQQSIKRYIPTNHTHIGNNYMHFHFVHIVYMEHLLQKQGLPSLKLWRWPHSLQEMLSPIYVK